MTDGNAIDDDVPEKEALDFARQAGVPIFALGLPWVEETHTPTHVKDENGNRIESVRVTREERPPNRAVLERFTDASGGRTYVVESAKGLPGLFAKLEHDLRTRYLVSFESNAKRTGSFHPVEIRVAHGTVRMAAGFSY